ncbi:uncharacterized protein H6S33_001936 [Morchella sextelata]|uniref:uncharacterized protein n=1 Tax=Morchella sextelata TaxID=1174677 RepID=UPI001D04A4C8|nr:uncharacterized protein H6S33_001936 [Morchella sextelata]KAH0607884.1 hypothetical protein H6S33_001936 [Morchella sextelata]
MSFGFSVGDFAGTLQLAWTLYTKCYKIAKGAPKDFKCLIEEINMLHSSIKLLQDEATDKESILVRAGADRVDMVKRVVGQVDVTLRELEKHSKKYDSLGKEHSSSIRKWWTGVRWSAEASELDALRNKLVYHNGVISLLLTSCGNSSLQRIETITSKVEKGVNDIKDMIRTPAVGAPTLSAIQGDRLFSISLSETLMKSAEIGRKWSAIGVDEWIQAGSWWLLKSQMDLYTGLPSERKITWQGYANLIKAAWILIDIITRHPQLDFLETSTAYGVELLVETIRRELENINKSGLARPTLAELVRDVAPYPNKNVMQIKDQKVLFSTTQDVQHLCAITEAAKEYLFCCKFKENDPEILRSFTLLFSIKNNYGGVVRRLLEDEEVYTEAEKLRENTRAKYSTRLLLEAKELAKLTNQSILMDEHREKSTSKNLSSINEVINQSIKNLSLFVWCTRNEYDAVALLLCEGKGIPIGDREEDLIMCRPSPLHNAVLNKNLELIKLFSFEDGFDIDARDDSIGSHGRSTALEIASEIGFIAAVNILLEAGADSHRTSYQALFYAACSGHLDVVNRLLEAGADVNAGQSQALRTAAERGRLDVVNRLLEAGADVNAGESPALSEAAWNGHLDVVNRLLEAGADVNSENCLPLFNAVRRNYFVIAAKLLKAGANIQSLPECEREKLESWMRNNDISIS